MGMTVATFLSYSHKDKRLAGNIKAKLKQYGFDCFLAHEDIAPSVEWQEEILRQLQGCDALIAVLTSAFDNSDWTHQEIGIAFGRGPIMPIMVPVKVTRMPVGFLSRFQAITVDPEELDDTCLQIAKIVASKSDRLGVEIRAALISALEDAGSFDRAGSIASRLRDIDGLTPDEMNRLLKIATGNDQVYASGSASRPLRELIRRHKSDIKKSVLAKFRRVWSYR